MKQGQVYLITNQINGMRYIGSTMRSAKTRWRTHVSGSTGSAQLLHNAVLEFGKENFGIEVLFEGSHEQILIVEKILIERYKTTFASNGYNKSIVASKGFFGGHYKHTKASREKIGRAHKGKILSEETRAKLSIAHKGKILSLEHRAKLSRALKGNKRTLGYTHSLQTREKMRLAHVGKKFSLEHREKMRISAQQGWIKRYQKKVVL